jgi:hypothetical protein
MGTVVYLPQSFTGIVWHQQFAGEEAAVGVVGLGAGTGADPVRVSTTNKFRMVSMVVSSQSPSI